MGKKGRWPQRARDWMAEYAFFVTLFCVIAVIVSSALYTTGVRRRMQQGEVGVQAAAQAPEVLETASPEAPIVTPLPTIAPLVVRAAVLEAEAQWPLEGEVLRGHDLLVPVYWEALDAFRTHPGLDVAGEAEETVRCMAEGTVERTALDALWGWSVQIAQHDGAQACYRGLATCHVKAGDHLRAGDSLGTLLESIPCESELQAHLHLEIKRNGILQDPLATLEER